MYREQWVQDILRGRSVLAVALDVHMTTTGSLDRPTEQQSSDIRALQEVDADWQNPWICDFDDCVRALIQAALKEASSPRVSRYTQDFVSGMLDRQEDNA